MTRKKFEIITPVGKYMVHSLQALTLNVWCVLSKREEDVIREQDTKKKTRKSILSYSTKWFYRHRVNSDLQELERRIEAYVGSSKGVISSWNNDENMLWSTVSTLVVQNLGTCEK